jgi:branched-chain amino acid transport system substrate-binding protein
MLAALLAATVLVAGCGGDDEASGGGGDGAAAESDPIVIGAANGQTGFMSIFDIPSTNGQKLAVKEINAAGGVAGRKLELRVEDIKTDVNQIAPGALKLLDGGADVITTSCDYDFGGPAAREAQNQGKIGIGCAGAPLFGVQGIGPMAFNAYAATPTEGAVMAEFAMRKDFGKAFLLQDTAIEYSKTVCDYFEQHWTSLGGEIAGKDTFQNEDPSVASQVTRLEGSDADFVALCSYPPGGAAAVKQIRGAGIDMPIVGAGGFDGIYWLEGIQKLSDFYNPAVGSLHGDDPNQGVNDFIQSYTDEYGEAPASATYPLMGYTMIQAIARAVEAADGSTDGQALKAALEGFKDEDLIAGPTTYTEACHISLGRRMQMIEIQDGKASFLETVEPESVPESPC